MSFKPEDLPLRRNRWLKAAGIPRARLGWDFDDCEGIEPSDIAKVMKWLDAVKAGKVIRADGQRSCGKGLLFYGKPGNGKTTLAVVILQHILRTFSWEAFNPSESNVLVKPVYFTTFSELLNVKGREMENDDEAERLYLGMLGECADDAYNIRILVIDDAGQEHVTGSGWQRSIMHHVLRTRFNNGLPTIVTTNVELSAWDATYGDATESFAREAFNYLILKSNRGDMRK
jgi:DNA replication protein DnaC